MNMLMSQARTNWSPWFGDLHREINPRTPKACRWCSDCSSVAALPTDEPEAPRRKRARCSDAIACPECSTVHSVRSAAVGHLKSIHEYSHEEARQLLKYAPRAPPRDPSERLKCPYCPRRFNNVPAVNRHIREHPDHMALARVRTASMPRTPPTPTTRANHPCPEDGCSFTSSSKGGLTNHLRRTHDVDRRVAKPHRPSDCEESIQHILFVCPRLYELRLKHNITPDGADDLWTSRRLGEFLLEALAILPTLGYESPLFAHLTVRVQEADLPVEQSPTGQAKRQREAVDARRHVPKKQKLDLSGYLKRIYDKKKHQVRFERTFEKTIRKRASEANLSRHAQSFTANLNSCAFKKNELEGPLDLRICLLPCTPFSNQQSVSGPFKFSNLP